MTVKISDNPNKLTRLQRAFADMGAADATLYLTSRLLRAATRGRFQLRKYYFLVQPVPDAPLLPPHRGRDIHVAPVGAEEAIVRQFPRPAAVISRRFQSGATCFVATRGGNFVGFLWLQQPSYLEDEVRCLYTPMPAGQAVWDFDVHVEDAHRGSLAFARLWDAANQYCRARGIRWSMSRISAFNPGSLKSHARLGAAPIASASYLCGRRWQLMISDTAPYVYFSSGDRRVPDLRLDAHRSVRRPGKRRSA